MKSCHNCKNQHICAIYRQYDQATQEGLKFHILTTNETPNEKTTSSWMGIFKAIARSCNHYTVWETRQSLTKDAKKYAKDLADGLKKNKYFTKEFLNAPSPEARIKLIDQELDNNYDKIIDFLSKCLKNQEEAEDCYESFEHEVMSHFGV